LVSCAFAQGSFIGDAVLKLLPNGKDMEVIELFGFVDSSGARWEVPKGTVVDGASIPRALWSIVGSPFTGKYRKASVIHDYFCETMSRPWQDVHKVFFDAQLAEGNSEYHAKVLYGAVYAWGPRWDIVDGRPKRTRRVLTEPSKHDLEKLQEYVKLNNPNASAIAVFAEKSFPR
jgi:hypothetical protein